MCEAFDVFFSTISGLCHVGVIICFRSQVLYDVYTYIGASSAGGE